MMSQNLSWLFALCGIDFRYALGEKNDEKSAVKPKCPSLAKHMLVSMARSDWDVSLLTNRSIPKVPLPLQFAGTLS